MSKPNRTKKGPSRLARTLRSLLFMIGVGAILAGYNAYAQRRDVALATGPPGPAQRDFFRSSVDRPDIDLFFKGLSPGQRLAMATHLGEYDDPELAGLIGKLLGTFDAAARKRLTASLIHVGRVHPDAVADQLKVSGSLQQFAIATALRNTGTKALPAVAEKLASADARANASAYLVASGSDAIPFVLPQLQSDDKDTRLAAADTLGKLGAKQAVSALLKLYEAHTDDERYAYLSALAGIGSPECEPLLTAAAEDETMAGPRRAQAMLGLGRIGSPSAIRTLWKLDNADDPQLRDAVISGLQLAGNAALELAPNPAERLRVAAGVFTPESENWIARSLPVQELTLKACEAAANRPALVDALAKAAKASTNGEVTDAAMRSLASTPQGLKALESLTKDPAVGGFAMRRLDLARKSG